MTTEDKLIPGEPIARVLIEKRFKNGCKWWDSVTISGVDAEAEARKLVDILNQNSLYVYQIKEPDKTRVC